MENKQFGMKSTFSLRKLIDFWRSGVENQEECIGTDFAKRLVSDIEKVPELMNPITDFSILEKHKSLVDTLMSAVIPPAYWDTNLQAIAPAFEFKAVYCTDRFAELFLNEKREFGFDLNIAPHLFDRGKIVAVYAGILQQFYGHDMTVVFPIIRSITDKQTRLQRYFKMNIDNRFMDVKVLGPLPEVTKEHVTLLSENLMNVDMWYEIIPPELFEFEGFITFNMFEVTDQEALSKLKYDLLDKNILLTQDGFEVIENRIRTTFRNPCLRLGLASISSDKSHLLNSGHKIGNSFLLSDRCIVKCSGYSNSIYQKAIDTQEPQIIYDLEVFPDCTPIEKEIAKMGIKNILVAPLVYEGKTIGIFEIGSPIAGDINSINGLKLVDILPLFSVAMKRSLEDMENKVQAIIKEKCTAIHPSVEWRFRKAAIKLLEKERTDEYAQLEEIRFKDVYPLYALSDIRNSSVIRNSTIQADLKENLLMAKDVINAACSYKEMPVLDHLNFRIDKRIAALEGGLSSGDEAGIVIFLKNEIEPLFEKLASYGENVKSAIEKYTNSLDPGLGIVYNKRKAYEESVAQLNESIASFIEDEEEKAQSIFPHYFEKYKTDGVEFAMYIGDSISEKEKFSPIYLKNIRLWQFLVMCGIAAKSENIKSKLKVPLELAHLILVQNNPLSIRFHFDQKKFDVDGTYNVHYEIMKKRIDKAEIRGKEERLTQPGKIAIIYTQASEAYEYKQYIEYLQSKGCLEKEIEELELEDLQGVYGLKALRVTVSANSNIFESNLSKDEINNVIKELAVTN
jgi:GAF domain-containing protein